MKDNQELKPCPFCGGDAELITGKHRILGDLPYKVVCANKDCEIYYLQTKSKFSRKEAIKVWNRRVNNG